MRRSRRLARRYFTVAQARSIAGDIAVLALNATEHAAADTLTPWLASGQTVAFVGSSGIAKSALVNALAERAS